MGIVDDFLNGFHAEVDATMGTKTMTCDGQSFSVVWDDFRYEKEGDTGGLELQIQAQATAQVGDVTSPMSLLHKQCTVAGSTFRIFAVFPGDVAIRFDLGSAGESR